MSTLTARPVLTETFWTTEGSQIWLKRLVLVVAGRSGTCDCRQDQDPHVARRRSPLAPWPFLTIGAAYGPRLGLGTVLAYLAVGALGFDVFAGSSAEKFGLSAT